MLIKEYYRIAKPGMVYGNLIPVIGGLFLASRGIPQLGLFVATMLGIALVMASSCVFNNVIDRDIDGKMQRTKNRAVVAGRISPKAALTYGTVLGLLGFMLLMFHVNHVAAAVAAVGFFFYVVMYSMWWKRGSVWGTEVGSVAGAVPAVVGYVAVSGRLDLAAALLFAIMVAWQMPHFYAIAIRHAEDYAAAGIPVLPLVRKLHATKVQMMLYIVAFLLFASLLSVFGYAGLPYRIVAILLGAIWMYKAALGFKIPDSDKEANKAWAKKVFLFSLVVMMGLFGAMVVDAML